LEAWNRARVGRRVVGHVVGTMLLHIRSVAWGLEDGGWRMEDGGWRLEAATDRRHMLADINRSIMYASGLACCLGTTLGDYTTWDMAQCVHGQPRSTSRPWPGAHDSRDRRGCG
jgi:hypothetical protein